MHLYDILNCPDLIGVFGNCDDLGIVLFFKVLNMHRFALSQLLTSAVDHVSDPAGDWGLDGLVLVNRVEVFNEQDTDWVGVVDVFFKEAVDHRLVDNDEFHHLAIDHIDGGVLVELAHSLGQNTPVNLSWQAAQLLSYARRVGSDHDDLSGHDVANQLQEMGVFLEIELDILKKSGFAHNAVFNNLQLFSIHWWYLQLLLTKF